MYWDTQVSVRYQYSFLIVHSVVRAIAFIRKYAGNQLFALLWILRGFYTVRFLQPFQLTLMGFIPVKLSCCCLLPGDLVMV